MSRSSSRSRPTARRGSPAASRWRITGEAARARVFQMRAQRDAIMVGIGTVLSDNPQLTCRLPGMFERSPVRVVLDATLRCRSSTAVVATVRETPTWVFTSRKASRHRRGNFAAEGLQGVPRRAIRRPARFRRGAEGARRRGHHPADGGRRAERGGGFVAAGLVDEVALVYAEKLIGADGIDPLDGMALDAINGHLRANGNEPLERRYSEPTSAMLANRAHRACGSKGGRQRFDSWLDALRHEARGRDAMFTGIVTDMGEVRSVKPRADNLHRITIACAIRAPNWSRAPPSPVPASA